MDLVFEYRIIHCPRRREVVRATGGDVEEVRVGRGRWGGGGGDEDGVVRRMGRWGGSREFAVER